MALVSGPGIRPRIEVSRSRPQKPTRQKGPLVRKTAATSTIRYATEARMVPRSFQRSTYVVILKIPIERLTHTPRGRQTKSEDTRFGADSRFVRRRTGLWRST